MKVSYIKLLLCIAFLISCNSQKKNRDMSNLENHSILIVLQFYPSGVIEDTRYSICINNDSLIVNNYSPRNIDDIKYCKISLNEFQLQEINEMVLDIKKHSSQKDNTVLDTWGVQLKINGEVFYNVDDFSFNSPPTNIKKLINYLVSLSPIKIDLYGFS